MKTKLLFAGAALVLLFTACEEEEGSYSRVIYPDDPFTVNVYAGMPAVYGYADGNDKLPTLPVAGTTIKVYPTKEDYQRDRNVLIEGLTDSEGKFSFEYDSVGTFWFSAYKEDTLSNRRGISRYSNDTTIDHNQIIITGWKSDAYENYHGVFATLTNTPTQLRLSVYHNSQPVEGAQVQLYFTKQAYQDSLAAQEDFEQLRPTYGYYEDDPSVSDEKEYFIWINEDNFLQTTNESGEVYFDNLEPRNYWFRITKDTLSNKETTIRTLRALPRTDITNIIEVGIQ